MAFRALALVALACCACGRLGFEREDDDGDDTDVTDTVDDTDFPDDTDNSDDTDTPPFDAPPDSDAAPVDSAPDSPAANCLANPLYVSIGAFPSRYRSMSTLTSWPTAVAECGNDGAHLAVPDSMAEATAIGDLGDWVGISDAATEGAWLTIFDTVPAYLIFEVGQPDGGTSEDCLRIDGSGELEDRECADARDFVCECPL